MAQVRSDYILAFQKWCALDGKAASGPKYVGYLSCFNKDYAEPTHSSWNGLYAYLYGHPAECDVVEIGDLSEFVRIYGGIRQIFTGGECPPGASAEHFDEAVKWAQSPEVKGPSCLNAAMNAYCDFLQWKESLADIVEQFKMWLSRLERNKGKGYKAKTVERYVDALVLIDNVLPGWGVDLQGRNLRQVVDPKEFASVEQKIRDCPQFPGYNDNVDENGKAKNLNGTGNGDPSAALIQFRLFLEEGNGPGVEEPGATFDLDGVVKLFAKHRLDEEWVKLLKRDGYEGLYARYAAMNADALQNMTAAEFDKWVDDELWAARTFFCGQNIKKLSEDDKRAVCRFISVAKKRPQLISAYFGNGAEHINGVGPVIITELLMKFHPLDYCNYNVLMLQGLKVLGLVESEKMPSSLSVAEYQKLMGFAADILERLTEAKVPRMFNEDENSKPDYITVNEFLWWCKAHQDLIKEMAMNATMKKDPPTVYDTGKRKTLEFDPATKDDELLLRLLASLRAKPFAILAGHSGTGKSRYVKKLAYMTCNARELRKEGELPGNYLMLQVRPNWHDSTDLLGFRNAMDSGRYQKTALIEFLFRAYHFKDTPFFLCLDEMNLAPVEQYFAEFLSAMESKEPVPLNDIAADEDNLFALGCEWEDAREYLKAHKFSIPKNLFIVGTVNMDETTNQFSRKVLDRAFTIEMTDVDFMKFDGTNCPEPSYEDTIEETKIQELLKGEFCATKLDDEDRAEGSSLIKVQKALEPTPFAIAYRFASEYTLLKRALEVFDPGKTMQLDALDQAVLMKVLPRVAGEAEYITKVYGKDESEGLRHALEGKTVSLKKIAEILKRAQDTGAQYITFWP